MPSIMESISNQSQMNAELVDSLSTLSLVQTITFTQYVRVVLPLDGFVFWVKADLLSPSALLNAACLNTVPLDQEPIAIPAPTLSVKGSLHYVTTKTQEEDDTEATNQVVFSTATEIQDINGANPNILYIGEFDFPDAPTFLADNGSERRIRFAFSRHNSFYLAAGIYHYEGTAILPVMESQIIDDPAAFDAHNIVVSNSLPIWLALSQAMPQVWQPPRQMFPVFPSFAVPDNEQPPYAVIHIEPSQTRALQAAPFIDAMSCHWQLATDHVRLTFYGLRNNSVQDYMDAVNQYSLDTDMIGLMNMPIIRDEKRPQAETGTLAMKKTAEFDVSYYQSRVNDVARQLIVSAIPSITLGD